MSLLLPPSDRLEDLLGDLEAASKLPARSRLTSIKSTVEKATSLLYDQGAPPEELARLVDLLTQSNELDQASLAAITRNLYPSDKVDDEIVLRFVGALGHGCLKPSFPLQCLFLKWLVMVHHLLQNPTILSQVYGVLFNLLATAAIRPQLCHLLALITRRKHVRPFRIQSILNLSRQTGGDPNLTGLLRVFKNYYPEIIVGELTKGRAATFKHPDPNWRERLNEIQQQQQLSRQNDDGGTRNGFAVNSAIGRQMRGVRALFPAVHTQHAQESSVTLEEIDNAEALVRNLDKIELPTQLVAVLGDPLLQKLLLLRPNSEASSRVSNWVMACVGDVASGDADPALLLDMVEVIRDYAVSTKWLPPLLLSFFAKEFLPTWNGKDKQDMVFEALSLIPLLKFQDLFQILQPFENAILDNTPTTQLSLLSFYTTLLRRWGVLLQASPNLESLPLATIPDFITHVNTLTLALTQTSPRIPTFLAILDFYDAAAIGIYSRPKLLRHVNISIPPPLLVYLLTFSPSLAVVSRLCSILAAYKRAWESVMTSPTLRRQLTKRERDQVNIFNGFLMDICNCLWRGRAFSTTDLNAQGCRIPRTILPSLEAYVRSVDEDLSLGILFGLSHSPVLSLESISFVRELEDTEQGVLSRHAGPVTQPSLNQLATRGGLRLTWQDYRAGVLRYLDKKGLPGIPDLMYNTMKNLMKTRQSLSGS
ncbi:centromere protein I [Podospora australis]|uniref:Centromere protein I n=1 Tax=Podospora australis TaxID=1536484 RepID=A0AAN7AJ46_9PEZI|nr:centromere protein I [Podospora australis]